VEHHLGFKGVEGLLQLYLLVEVDLPHDSSIVFLQLSHYLLEILNLREQILLSAAVVVASFFAFDFLKLISQGIEFAVDFAVVAHILFECPFGVGDSLLDLIQLAHHAVEVIVDQIFLAVDFALDEVGIGVHHHLQGLDVSIEVGYLVLLVPGRFHQIGKNSRSGGEYVLLRLFLRVSYWKLFSNILSISCLKECRGSAWSRIFIFEL
jgi:hypothetical protein